MDYGSTPIGRLVIERPSRARVLERRAIDYCCQGRRTLAEACAHAALPLHEVIEDLQAESLEPALSSARVAILPRDPAELIRHILEVHHAYLWAEMPRLTEMAAKVLRAHGDRRPELAEVARVWSRMRDDLEPHLTKEEGVLFPWILRLAGTPGPRRPYASVRAPIDMMESEHETVGRFLVELRFLTEGFQVPPGACPTYHAFYEALERLESDTHAHIHAENNLLFPLALELEGRGA